MVGVAMEPSAVGTMMWEISSRRLALRKAPQVVPPPSTRAVLMLKRVASLWRARGRLISVLPAKR
jgi:hypothetical protein